MKNERESIRKVIIHLFSLSHMIWGINYVHIAQTMWGQTLLKIPNQKYNNCNQITQLQNQEQQQDLRVWLQDS